jgi:hypothetical protein
MKKICYLFIVCAMSTQVVNAQDFTFSQKTETYTELTGSTVFSDQYWSDFPIYTVPLSFSFDYYGNDFSTIYVSGGFTGFNYDTTGGFNDLSGNEVHVFDAEIGDGDSAVISYKTEGTPGNRIFKMQWYNANFENDDDNLDYVNFQLWLFENGDKIEMHYGSSSVVNNDSYFPFGGPQIGLFNETGSKGIFLGGSPANPTVMNNPQGLVFLTGTPSNGQVYVFTPTTGTGSRKIADAAVKVSPNPFSSELKIEMTGQQQMSSMKIYDLQGRLLRSVNISEGSACTVNTHDLPAGIYFLQLTNGDKVLHRKIVKN